MAALESAAPTYPLMQTFRRQRLPVAVGAGVATFVGVAAQPDRGGRALLIGLALGAGATLATALLGELVDVVCDTLLPQ